jgi:hypothetical protein
LALGEKKNRISFDKSTTRFSLVEMLRKKKKKERERVKGKEEKEVKKKERKEVKKEREKKTKLSPISNITKKKKKNDNLPLSKEALSVLSAEELIAG